MKRLSRTLVYVPILIAIFLVGQFIAGKTEVETISPHKQSLLQTHLHEMPFYKNKFALSQVVIAAMLCQKVTSTIELTSSTLIVETEELDINLLTATSAFFCLLLLFSNYSVLSNLKQKTPKKIINLVSIVHSWIKPIKGCPS
ncbi:hypothetical protein swp_3359 [Shewanella piezotolerans WP3]|uniref:Uncharacterized protein n=1 Tax=Shewanella piezotolerans (strain WP3 / JCM 13877) TaxID=225849 RepID=B8CRQ3_SHEPW|nr:hypothetical protein [Shewanella piezotolerans]ACJ30061.1 hypothetical protein swp_3359 [Shewanella piezotolerans WP3]